MSENDTSEIQTFKSNHSVSTTINILEHEIHKRGMNVFARINHSAGAKKIGTDLRPTELIIFGSPQGGTPFMECSQLIGLDLPLKVLAWEDKDNIVWLSYRSVKSLAQNHQITECAQTEKLDGVLKGMLEQACKKT